MTASPWFKCAVALALGLLIGLERERTKGHGPTRRAPGIRTFALATLLGALAAHLGGAVLLAVVTAAVAVLTALSYVRIHDADPGMTTEVGLAAAPLLGGVAMSDPLLASGLSVAVAVVFAAKAPLHSFTRDVLTAAGVKDGLVFAIATLVIWPLLPDLLEDSLLSPGALGGSFSTLAIHRGLLHDGGQEHPRAGMCRGSTLLNGITQCVSPMRFSQHPRAKLTNGDSPPVARRPRLSGAPPS